jgi:hypothetical protein
LLKVWYLDGAAASFANGIVPESLAAAVWELSSRPFINTTSPLHHRITTTPASSSWHTGFAGAFPEDGGCCYRYPSPLHALARVGHPDGLPVLLVFVSDTLFFRIRLETGGLYFAVDPPAGINSWRVYFAICGQLSVAGCGSPGSAAFGGDSYSSLWSFKRNLAARGKPACFYRQPL